MHGAGLMASTCLVGPYYYSDVILAIVVNQKVISSLKFEHFKSKKSTNLTEENLQSEKAIIDYNILEMLAILDKFFQIQR